MQKTNYDRVITEAKALNLAEQLRLLEEIALMIRQRATGSNTRSILELRGKGKEIWNGIDIEDYLNQERSAWNG